MVAQGIERWLEGVMRAGSGSALARSRKMGINSMLLIDTRSGSFNQCSCVLRCLHTFFMMSLPLPIFGA